MADHIRKLIRADVVSRLKAQISEVGGRVYGSRVIPLGDSDLPCLNVLTLEEALEGTAPQSDPVVYLRDLSLVVEVATVAETDPLIDPADANDDLCLLVEQVVLADRNHSRNADDCDYETTVQGVNKEGAKNIILAQMTFPTIYHLDPVEPEDLGDFRRAGIKIDVEPADGQTDQSTVANIQE